MRCTLNKIHANKPKEYSLKKSRIRETQTLSTDTDSRTDTILERLHDLPIRTEKRTWSSQKCGLGPRLGGDSVHAKMLTRFTPEHIPVFRALLEIEIALRNTSSFLGLYSRSRSRSNSGTHPHFQGSTQDQDQDRTPEHILVFRALLELEIKIEIEIKFRNTSSFLGLYSRSRSNSQFLGLYLRSRLRSNSGTHPCFQGSTQDQDQD